MLGALEMLLSTRLLRAGLFCFALPGSFCLIPSYDAAAQLRRGSERGRVGILGGRIDERLNRSNPAALPNNGAPRNVVPRNGAPNNGAPSAAAGYRGPLAPPQVGPGNQLGPTPADTNPVQSAAYAGPSSLPPNRLPYKGAGVIVRLPSDLGGEVNYVLDGAEHLVIHPGDEQRLDSKGSYNVRFSRGVTEDGREYGEGNYTITEGVYRFAVTDRGWELYREPDSALSRIPGNRLPLSQLEIPQTPAVAATSSPGVEIPQPPAFEETLPAPHPRSILER